MPDLDFEFYVRNLERGILGALRAPMIDAVGGKGFLTYSGELDDAKKVSEAINALISSAKFPLTMVGYAGGDTDPDTREAPLAGTRTEFTAVGENLEQFVGVGSEPRQFMHMCKFGLILADRNMRAEADRRNKVYQMMSVVWETLTDLSIYKVVDGIDKPVLLNELPIETGEIGRIIQPEITAYKVDLYTAFRWTSPDRTRTDPPVRKIHVEIDSIWPVGTAEPKQVPPGVEYEIDDAV